MDTDAILEQRGKVYGKFIDQASITIALIDVLHGYGAGWTRLDVDMQEALYMIAIKIARILNGDPHYADNWQDIEGYAALVRKRLEGK